MEDKINKYLDKAEELIEDELSNGEDNCDFDFALELINKVLELDNKNARAYLLKASIDLKISEDDLYDSDIDLALNENFMIALNYATGEYKEELEEMLQQNHDSIDYYDNYDFEENKLNLKDTIICPGCNHEIQSNAKVCPRCGIILDNKENENDSNLDYVSKEINNVVETGGIDTTFTSDGLTHIADTKEKRDEIDKLLKQIDDLDPNWGVLDDDESSQISEIADKILSIDCANPKAYTILAALTLKKSPNEIVSDLGTSNPFENNDKLEYEYLDVDETSKIDYLNQRFIDSEKYKYFVLSKQKREVKKCEVCSSTILSDALVCPICARKQEAYKIKEKEKCDKLREEAEQYDEKCVAENLKRSKKIRTIIISFVIVAIAIVILLILYIFR